MVLTTNRVKPQSQELVTGAFTIAVEGIGKRFNREWIFRNFTYRFTSGNTYALTGPNGSGKSTLLQVLWGQVPQTMGSIRYLDNETEIDTDKFYQHLAIATPYMDLIEEFTLRETIDFHFRLKRVRKNVRMEEIADKMYLREALDKQLINFSSGMRQRLKLALAFYTEADVYFLDEPGTNLDTQAFIWYQTQLKDLPRDAVVIIASNDPEEYPGDAINVHMMDIK